MADDGDGKNIAEESGDQTDPACVPGIRRAVHTVKECFREGRDRQDTMDVLSKILREKPDQQRPGKQLQSF